ncbi:MAG TPA: hypothetical protein VF905_01575 [Nitrospirota bacterium]
MTTQKASNRRLINKGQFSSSKRLVIEGNQHYPMKHGGKVRD